MDRLNAPAQRFFRHVVCGVLALLLCALAGSLTAQKALATPVEIETGQALAEALDNQPEGELSLQLKKDVKLDRDLMVKGSQTVTLDGTGHTLDLAGHSIDVDLGGSLTLDATGKPLTVTSTKALGAPAFGVSYDAYLTCGKNVVFSGISSTAEKACLVAAYMRSQVTFGSTVVNVSLPVLIKGTSSEGIRLSGSWSDSTFSTGALVTEGGERVKINGLAINKVTAGDALIAVNEGWGAHIINTQIADCTASKAIVLVNEATSLIGEKDGKVAITGCKVSNGSPVVVSVIHSGNAKGVGIRGLTLKNNTSGQAGGVKVIGQKVELECTGLHCVDNKGGKVGGMWVLAPVVIGGDVQVFDNDAGLGYPSNVLIDGKGSLELEAFDDTNSVAIGVDTTREVSDTPLALIRGAKKVGENLRLNENVWCDHPRRLLVIDEKNDNQIDIKAVDGSILDAPLGFRAQGVGFGKVRLEWEPIPWADGYAVYRKVAGENGLRLMGYKTSDETLELLDTTANPHKPNFYFVRAYVNAQYGEKSFGPFARYVYALPSDPERVTGLKVEAEGETGLRVSWNAALGATDYSLSVITSDGTTREVYLGPELSARVDDLEPLSVVSFFVYGYRIDGAGQTHFGAISKTVSTLVGFPDVSSVKAKRVGSWTKLEWTYDNPTVQPDCFTIFRKVGNEYRYLYIVPATRAHFTDLNPVKGETNSYFIRPAKKVDGKLRIAKTYKYAAVAMPS